MTIRDALAYGTKRLQKTADRWSSIALDSELLLAHALAMSREDIYRDLQKPVSASALRKFRSYLARRTKHEPIAYIVGEKEFFGIPFFVKKNVCLIPRPETEVLVERALKVIETNYARRTTHEALVIDVGTGSGAIAVTVAKHAPKADVVATDISPTTLNLARKNAKRHGVTNRIHFIKSDLLPPYTLRPTPYALILANLPYIPTAEYKRLPLSIRRYEPRLALDGGKNGLDLYRKLLTQIKEAGTPSFTLLAEIHPEQKAPLTKAARSLWKKSKISFHKDLAGKVRVIEIEA